MLHEEAFFVWGRICYGKSMKNNKTISIAVIAIIIIVGIVLLAKRHAPENTREVHQDEQTQPALQANEEKPMDTTTVTTTPKTTTTASGLQITITKEGAGEGAVKGDLVAMKYTGRLTTGKVFDSNEDPAFGHTDPFSFVLGQNMVIQGWEEGVLGMKVGEKRTLTIPASLGYGDRGVGNIIPPGATLVFDVEVLSITKN